MPEQRPVQKERHDQKADETKLHIEFDIGVVEMEAGSRGDVELVPEAFGFRKTLHPVGIVARAP